MTRPMQRTLWGEDEPVSLHGVRWSDAEDARLSELWGVWGIVEIAREFGREPSSVRAHAREIGLPMGMPSGYEPIGVVAKRHRIRRRDVAKAIWSHNVPMAVSLNWIPGEHRVRYVDASLIDDAIAKWRLEPPVRKRSRRPDDSGILPSLEASGVHECVDGVWFSRVG